jgi:hypothetical protein
MKKLDDTGLHATECTCARCEAGFRPTLKQRWDARRALEAQKRRLAADKVAAETRVTKDARAAASRLSIAEDVRFTDRKLQEIRAVAHPRDPRTELFLALRKEGKSLSEAESIVDLRYPHEPPTEGTNDADES